MRVEIKKTASARRETSTFLNEVNFSKDTRVESDPVSATAVSLRSPRKKSFENSSSKRIRKFFF